MGSIPAWVLRDSGLWRVVPAFLLLALLISGVPICCEPSRTSTTARWGLHVYHYGSALPFATEGNLFLTNSQMLLETGIWPAINTPTTIEKILLLNSRQVPRLSGGLLADLLELNKSSLLCRYTGKMDQHDPAGRNHALIMMIFNSPTKDVNLLILATARRLSLVARLFANPIYLPTRSGCLGLMARPNCL